LEGWERPKEEQILDPFYLPGGSTVVGGKGLRCLVACIELIM